MKYSGMTVNERLYVSGLFKSYDKAVKEKDKEKLINILSELELDKKTIIEILRKHKIKIKDN